jgi:(2Fe-2S) ferredoxin
MFKKHVFVCITGGTCPDQGSLAVFDALRKEIADRGLKKSIRINKAGCFDQCGNGPMVVVYPQNTWYAHVKVADCQEIVESDLLADRVVTRLLYDGRGKIIEPASCKQ